MDDAAPLLLAAALAGVTAAICTPLAKRIALRVGLVDHPGGHRVHSSPTPVFGGFAVAVGVVVGTSVVAGLPIEVTATLGVALGLAVVGFADDRRPLPPTVRLALEAAGGLALAIAGARTNIGPAWLDPVLVVLWFVAVVNASNMIDNHDGICSSLGGLAAAGAAVIALRGGADDVGIMAAALTGAAIGFLPFNLPKASIFLGDTGSMFIGATVAGAVLWLPTPSGSSLQRLTVAALLLLVPFLDEGTAIITRLREGRGPMMASTDHLSHRLRMRGATPRRVVASLAGLQAVASGTAVVVWGIRGQQAIAVAAATCLVIGVALLLAALHLPHPAQER